MSLLRLFGLSTLLVASFTPSAQAADSAPRLLPCVPAGAAAVMHMRSVTEVREQFARSPYARLWAEPEVQAYFAPAIGFLNSPEAQGALGKFADVTGLPPLELLGMFGGEAVASVTLTFDAEGEPLPQIVVGGVLGGNRARFEAAVQKVGASDEAVAAGTVVEEEIQGETLHTFLAKQKSGEPKETISWAIVGDVVCAGYPKAAVQGMVVNLKRGGAAEPITAAAGFAPLYGRNPSALGVYYINLEGLVRDGLSAYQAHEAMKKLAAEKAAEGTPGEPKKPSQFEQLGLTPEIVVHALGFDALRSLYVVSLGGDTMAAEGGITWSEQRGLLKMFAFGPAPAPQPSFPAPDWPEVTAMRYQPAGFLEAIKDAARTANPMFEFMIAQQLASLKQQVGIDLEKDFFGSFGDETVFARTYLENPADGLNGTEQLWATSVTSAETLSGVIDTALAMVPNGAEMFQEREYLGHKIRSITAPMPGIGGAGGMITMAFAVTPSHFFLDVGGTKMLETAIQRLDAEGGSFWAQPAVVAAMRELPGGSAGVGFQDASRAIYQAFVQLAQLTRMSQAAAATAAEPTLDENGRAIVPRGGRKPGEPGLERFINPDAVPSRETIARHLGTTVSGIYLDADGIRGHTRYQNAR